MPLTVDQLRDSIDHGLGPDALTLSVGQLDSKSASALAELALPGATLRLAISDPKTAVTPTQDGCGFVVAGTGVDLPFRGLPASLHLFVQGGEADFTLTAQAVAGWHLADALTPLAGRGIGAVPLGPSTKPALTLRSHAGDAQNPPGLFLDAVVDLKAISGDLATLVGIGNPHVAGTIDLVRRGSILLGLDVHEADTRTIDLGLFKVDVGIGVSLQLVYDPTTETFEALPTLLVDAALPVTIAGSQVVIGAEIIDLEHPIVLVAELADRGAVGLGDLAALMPLPNAGGKPDLGKLLPSGITAPSTVTEAAVTIAVDPHGTPRVPYVRLDFSQALSWTIWDDGKGRPLTATLERLTAAVSDPLGAHAVPVLEVEGSVGLGNAGTLELAARAAADWEVSAYLREGTTLLISEVLETFTHRSDDVHGLAIDALTVLIAAHTYDFEITLADDWSVAVGSSSFAIQEVEVALSDIACHLGGHLLIAGLPILVEADRGAPGEGWTFGGAALAPIPLDGMLGWLQSLLQVVHPLPATGLALGELAIAFTDGAKFAFHCSVLDDSKDWADLWLLATKDAGGWEHAFVAELKLHVGLDDLPLVGAHLAALGAPTLEGAVWSHTSRMFKQDELAKIAAALPGSPGAPATDLAAGMGFHANLAIGAATMPLGGPVDTIGPPPPPVPATGYKPAAPVDTTIWYALQKTFGPVQLERVGLRFKNDTAYLLVDGALEAGPLALALRGLGVGVDLTTYTPDFTIDGLDVGFNAGGIDLSGGLVRRAVTDSKGKQLTEYAGALTIKVGTYSIAAVGAYADDGGQPSFFVYAALTSPPLGGPSFFYVTGVAGGLGYNRGLNLPTVDQITGFPLISVISPEGDGGPLAKAGADPLQKLDAFGSWVTITPGDAWFAAGVRFTSYEMITSTAVLAVTLGPRVLVSLLGLSAMSIPTSEPEPIAYAEVALVAVLDVEEAILRVDAKLTPSSYVISRDARLTGGFAFYVWFDTGDFVVTFGGYNPQFDKPAQYPDVPRLGLNWKVSDELSITAATYFALTPAAIMAGGSLSAVWQSGSLRAWFDVEANFLLMWKPFRYAIQASVSLGATFTLDLWFFSVTVSIHVGVDLELWGPPFGGTATVDLDIISFTVRFGAGSPVAPPLTMDEFVKFFLPHAQDGSGAVLCANQISAGLLRDRTPATTKVQSATTAVDTVPLSWMVNPAELDMQLTCAVPVRAVAFADPAGTLEDDGVTAPTLGVPAMAAAHDDWDSSFTITITKAGAKDASLAYQHLRFRPVRQAAAKAVWGVDDINDSAQAPKALSSDQTLPGAVFGVRVTAQTPKLHFLQDAALATLAYGEAPVFPVAMTSGDAPALQPLQTPGQKVADTIAKDTSTRASVVRAFRGRGHGATLDPSTISVVHLTAGSDALLEEPRVAVLS
jgi:hypothetical protein